jgi:hypothetical protein
VVTIEIIILRTMGSIPNAATNTENEQKLKCQYMKIAGDRRRELPKCNVMYIKYAQEY